MPNSNTNANNATSNPGNSLKVTTVLANIGVSDSLDQDLDAKKEIDEQNTSGNAKEIAYSDTKVIGNGSFGVVFQAKLVETGELVAIKKVLQDKKFKNRELQIMKVLNHCNIVKLKFYFYCTGEKKDDIFLNLILEYVPETVYRIARHYAKSKLSLPLIYIKLYLYQLFRALAYIHYKGICHRDIKPQNLLLDPETSVLKLCDFGSAKQLVKGEPNVSYICSRYYRAPELIFGATDYSWNIDIWSAGCVFAELLLGRPLFPGESAVDQLVEIIKILGTPSREQIRQMNPNYVEFKFPKLKTHPWDKFFKKNVPPEATDLISKLLQYIPSQRLAPLEACAHPFFDELRNPNTTLPTGGPLPPLFNFTPLELSICPPLNSILIPSHYHESEAFKNYTQQQQQNLTSSQTASTTNSTPSNRNTSCQPQQSQQQHNSMNSSVAHQNYSNSQNSNSTINFTSNPCSTTNPTTTDTPFQSSSSKKHDLQPSPSSTSSAPFITNGKPQMSQTLNRRSDTPSKLFGNCTISSTTNTEVEDVLVGVGNSIGMQRVSSYSENPLPNVPLNSLISAAVPATFNEEGGN